MLRKYLILLTSVACLVAATAEVAPENSLDAFLAIPGRTSLVTCELPSSSVAAWVETVRGVSNVWSSTSSGETWKEPHAVSAFAEDDGTTISGLQFAPKCAGLFFVRTPIALANPSHLVSMPGPQTLYIEAPFGVSTTTPRVVAECEMQSLNADGSGVLCANEYGPVAKWGAYGVKASAGVDEYKVSADKDGPLTPTALFKVKKGTITSMEWSPDGRTLAFANFRGTHGFVGLWSVGSNFIKWVSPSLDSDTSPTWSPDGAHLAWIRELGEATDYDRKLGGHRGPSFEIWTSAINVTFEGVQDVGQAKRVYQELKYGYPDDGSGYGDRPLLWADDETLIFGTEAHDAAASDGWCHPVAVSIRGSAGEAVRDLMPGKCEVKHWQLGGTAGLLYMVHNCDSLTTRSISAVDVRTGDVQLHIPGSVDSVLGMSGDGAGLAHTAGGLLFFRTLWATPAAVYFAAASKGGGANPVLVSHNESLPVAVRPKSITFESVDRAFVLDAQVFTPDASVGSPASGAGIVFTHGGSQRQMFAAFHFSACYGALYALNQYMATVLGHTVISVNYRSGVGYGFDFRVCRACMWNGGAEYLDVRTAAQQLATMSSVSPDRIGIYGLSYGGLNTLQALTRNPNMFAAGVANAPVYNWVTQSRFDSATFLDVQPQRSGFHTLEVGALPNHAGPDRLKQLYDDLTLAFRSSPVSAVQNLTSPLLLIQGDADNEVAFSESIGVARSIRDCCPERDNVQSLVFPDETHGLARYESQLAAAQATADFLSEHLK